MPEPRPTEMTQADALWLRDLVRRRSAIVLDESKQYLLDSRLAPVVRSEGLSGIRELVAHARAGDARITGLVVEAMTTNETSWFRDGGPFDALRRTILPALLKARSTQRSIRIWSAACSSGQEAYSTAMVCRDVLPPGFGVEIIGTDISPAMVRKASEGRYSQLEVNRGLPAQLLVRWMTRSGSGWQVSSELQRMVRFREANLAAPFPNLGAFDVVLLRNVLIYFDAATKSDILTRIRPLVREDGVLVLGAAESALGLDVGWVREQLGATSVLRPAGAGPARQVPARQGPVRQVPVGPVPVRQVPVRQVPVRPLPVGPVPAQSLPTRPVPVRQAPVAHPLLRPRTPGTPTPRFVGGH